jgi:hypothetical protein
VLEPDITGAAEADILGQRDDLDPVVAGRVLGQDGGAVVR